MRLIYARINLSFSRSLKLSKTIYESIIQFMFQSCNKSYFNFCSLMKCLTVVTVYKLSKMRPGAKIYNMIWHFYIDKREQKTMRQFYGTSLMSLTKKNFTSCSWNCTFFNFFKWVRRTSAIYLLQNFYSFTLLKLYKYIF